VLSAFGGPIKEGLDPLRAWGYRYQGDGYAGLYLPKETQQGLTVSVVPAIQVNASDDGVIGFNASGSVGFEKLGVSLDSSAGGVLVDMDMNIVVEATCDLNIGCGIRLPIGHAIIQQTGSKAHLQMGFYPALDAQGNLKLRGTLKDVNMGSYVAIVVGIGTALKLLGVTSWIGFLIDVVLAAIISWKLPSVLRDEVKKYLGQNEWLLLRLGNLLSSTYPTGTRFASRFDVDGNTLLASVGPDA
jgi:hypothetical protein